MELKNLKSFGTGDSNQKVVRYTAGDRLRMMVNYYKKISDNVDEYFNSTTDKDKEHCSDSVTVGFNNYTQVFKDLTQLLAFKSSTSTGLGSTLSHFVNIYCRIFIDVTFDEDCMLTFIIRRNDLIHKYENYEELSEEVLNKFLCHKEGLLIIVNRINQKLLELDCIDFIMEKDD
jgi:hypothetical protein